ncbi:MAG: tyrosine-type recombinase/integrase [Limnoraphis robusta]|jgi:integrase/recombinase XerD
MGKNNRSGKAGILTDADYQKILQNIDIPAHKIIVSVLKFTGERIGAVIQLKVGDVYSDPAKSVVQPEITFRAVTRKASPTGERKTRQVIVAVGLKRVLEVYDPPQSGWLFPSPTNPENHISRQAVDKAFRDAVKQSGLVRKGLSLHSFRRTAITKLAEAGVPLSTIRNITGHTQIETLKEYVEVSEVERQRAIDLL